MPSIITAEQLAQELQLDPETVRILTRSGVLPHLRLTARTIRYNLDDVINACRVNVASEDQAVDQLAKAMHERLAEKRAEGKEGWEELDVELMWEKLVQAAAAGDPVDAANYAAMIYAQEKAR